MRCWTGGTCRARRSRPANNPGRRSEDTMVESLWTPVQAGREKLHARPVGSACTLTYASTNSEASLTQGLCRLQVDCAFVVATTAPMVSTRRVRALLMFATSTKYCNQDVAGTGIERRGRCPPDARFQHSAGATEPHRPRVSVRGAIYMPARNFDHS